MRNDNQNIIKMAENNDLPVKKMRFIEVWFIIAVIHEVIIKQILDFSSSPTMTKVVGWLR